MGLISLGSGASCRDWFFGGERFPGYRGRWTSSESPAIPQPDKLHQNAKALKSPKRQRPKPKTKTKT